MSVRTALAAAGWDVVNGKLKECFFHERFFIDLLPEHRAMYTDVLFPWLKRCRADAATVRNRAWA